MATKKNTPELPISHTEGKIPTQSLKKYTFTVEAVVGNACDDVKSALSCIVDTLDSGIDSMGYSPEYADVDNLQVLTYTVTLTKVEEV